MKIRFFVFVLLILCGTITFARDVKRIVSLAPSVTKNIYQMGAQDLLVGCTSFCTEALADGVEVVASAINVNMEKTINLKPDLVLAAEITSPETIDMFRKMGIEVKVFNSPESFGKLCEQFVEMGHLTGFGTEAKEIVDEAQKNIEQLLSKHQDLKSRNVFFQIGANPLFTVLPNTFMNDYISLIGGTNIAHDMSRGIISRESVVNRNPDLILIVTMGIAGDEEKETWVNFRDLNATKNGNIYIIDAEKACTPTPLTFVETLETIFSLIK